MANFYNSNPITLDTDMASGWRGLQTLNTGNLPATAQNSGVTRQFGIHIAKIVVTSNGAAGAVATGTILVVDPNDTGTVPLLTIQIPTTAAGTPFLPIILDWTASMATWRDFKVTGLQTTFTKMQIWYRA